MAEANGNRTHPGPSRPYTGFEDQERHQTPVTSACHLLAMTYVTPIYIQESAFTTATTTIIIGSTTGKIGKMARSIGSSQHGRANPGISRSRLTSRYTKEWCREAGAQVSSYTTPDGSGLQENPGQVALLRQGQAGGPPAVLHEQASACPAPPRAGLLRPCDRDLDQFQFLDQATCHAPTAWPGPGRRKAPITADW